MKTQIWGRYNGGPWELIDTSDAGNDIDNLLAEYQMAYSAEWEFELR
jgi:hypothetical protein